MLNNNYTNYTAQILLIDRHIKYVLPDFDGFNAFGDICFVVLRHVSIHVPVVLFDVHVCTRERRRSELESWLLSVRIRQLHSRIQASETPPPLPLELHLTTSELWFGQEQEGILP